MTVRSHLAEIFRQGLWASLTGGWFYDPAQSLFCNTVHLYMWLVLLLLPLLFSLATAGSHFSWTFTSGYVIIIVVIFAVLKTIVWYIHGIFDKNDPILVTKGDSEAVGGHSRQLSIVTEGMRTDATSDDPGNEIEMVEFTTSRREQPPLSTSAPGIFSGGSAEDIAAIVPEVTKQTRRCVRIVDNNVCGGDMAVVADVHLRPRDSIKVEEEHNSEEDDRSSGPPSDKALLPNSGSSAIMIPADSLELLPIGTRRQSDADTRNKTAIPRKLSEPSFDAYQSANVRSRRARRQSSDSEQPARSVRRARSSLETANAKQRNRSQSFVLSQRTLDECKNTTRKSYPSKTSSTDIFLTSGLRSNQEQTDEFSSANSSGLKLTLDVAESAHYGGSDPVIVEENEPESSEKSANESQDEAEDAKNLEVFLENIREKMESMAGAQGDTPTAESEDSVSPSKQRSMTPDLAWLFRERDGSDASQRKDREGRPDRPVVDAQSPIPSTTLSPLRRQRAARGESEPRPGTSTGPTSSDAMDLKGEIARLLEELIEKHPETLEAIESVRQSRLGRSAGDSRRRHRYVSTEEPGRRRSERATSLEPPPAALIALSDLSMRGDTHVATNHEDTSQGAVHSFQDEDGNWFTYSFDELGVGTAQSLGSSRALMEILHAQPRQTLTALPEAGFTETESDDDAEMGKSQRDRRRNNSSSSNDSATYMAELPVSILHPSSATQASRDAPPFANVAARLRHAARRSGRDQSTAASRLQQMMERAVAAAAARQLGAGGTTVTSPGDYSSATLGISRSIQTSSMGSGSSLNRIRFLTDLTGMSAAGTSIDSRRVSAKRKYYYRLMLCPKLAPGKMFKLQLDRLRLLALFDRNASLRSAAFDVFMAALVSVLAAMLLSRGLFVDQWLVLFCFVVAGAQFSLLKSVQPDAASPIHGYNWLVAYGRPAYFCILAVVLLAVESDWWNHEEAWHSIAWAWNPYRFDSTALATKMAAVRDFIIGLILLLPVAFTIGLLPQVNTFLMHVLEQVDMHLFGGTASFGLLSAAYNLGKSVLSSALLFALCQTALNWAGESTQSVLFSAFCAVLVSLSYLLSRSSSSPALLWCAVHEFVRKGDVGAEKDTNELVDPLPGRLKDTVSVRLKHDLLMSTVGGLLMFGLHCTSVFTATQPYLHHCLVGVAVAFGFFNHYAFPQLRKQTPFKLVARPILKAHEYGQFETSVQAKLMFFEKVHVWMRLLERNIVYPTLVISALTLFGAKMTPKWLMPLILPVIGLRLLRGGFSHPQLVYIPLLGASLLLTLDLERFDIADYFPLCFYAFVVVWPKALELMLKLEFILAYIAPWQISWGSAFHAFAQPFSIPHSALTWMQAFLSSIISA
uniref:Pecanex-like protein n=1 Tax=Plectus sambesii TaxID=2011161 RepID=A0A914W0W0_9BILA